MGEFERIRSILLVVEEKLPRAHRGRCRELAKKISRRTGWFERHRAMRNFTSDQIWELHAEVDGIDEWLRHMEIDLRWM
jgi:hypothetical protein